MARNVGGACHVHLKVGAASQTPGRGRRTAALQDWLWARGPSHSCSSVPATGQHLMCPSRSQSNKALQLSEAKRSLPQVPPARDQGPPRTRYSGHLPVQTQQVWGEALGTTAPCDHTARPQLGTAAAALCAGTVRTRVPFQAVTLTQSPGPTSSGLFTGRLCISPALFFLNLKQLWREGLTPSRPQASTLKACHPPRGLSRERGPATARGSRNKASATRKLEGASSVRGGQALRGEARTVTPALGAPIAHSPTSKATPGLCRGQAQRPGACAAAFHDLGSLLPPSIPGCRENQLGSE